MTLIDLHLHSTASDGVLSPTQVVRLAKERGLTTIALTDHDTTSGWAEAMAVGRARGMVKKLAELGMPLAWERVLHFAGDAQSIARPHVARALVEAGYVSSTQEAFDQYLNDQGPAYVHRLEVKPQEVIETIHQAGGVIVLSSPEHSKTTPLTPTLAALGLDGIEVYYFDHTDEKKAELLKLAQQYNLIVTGGSDFHGDKTHSELGSVYVPPEVLIELKECITRRH